MDLTKYIIYKENTILQAMKKIELNKQGFVLVLENRQLIGTLTDGDIRRAIISGNDIQTKLEAVLNEEFEYIYLSATFDDIVEKFKSPKIEFLPVIDHENQLLNVLSKTQFHEVLLRGQKINLLNPVQLVKDFQPHFEIFNRPWGFYKTIFLSDYVQAKIIHVFPNQQLSLQYHNFREEHWVVVKGNGKMTIGKSVKEVTEGSYIFIPKGCNHRIKNLSKKDPLIISEVQLGTYFGEDDIIRVEDDYGRKTN